MLSSRPSRVVARSRCCPPAPQGWPFGHGAVPVPIQGCPSVIVISPCPSRVAHQGHGAVLSPLKGSRSVTVLSPRPSRVAPRSRCLSPRPSRVAPRSRCCPPAPQGWPFGHGAVPVPIQGCPSVIVFSPCPSREAIMLFPFPRASFSESSCLVLCIYIKKKRARTTQKGDRANRSQ